MSLEFGLNIFRFNGVRTNIYRLVQFEFSDIIALFLL
jgi:hypothetical protein